MAPSYVAAIVGILMGFQSFLGLDLTTDEMTITILTLISIFTAIRQVITKRSTLAGMRPKD